MIWNPHIIQQVFDRLDEILHAKRVAVLVYKERDTKHCMLNGINDTYPAGVAIFLSTDWESVTQVFEWNLKRRNQPIFQPTEQVV